jgi:hypothetical protein
VQLTRMTLTEVRRSSCAPTYTVSKPSPTERDFILDHVGDLDPAAGARASFLTTSGMPAALTAMLAASPAAFEKTAQALAQRLHLRMQARNRVTDCILAIVGVADTGTATKQIAVLKLDMDNKGALGSRNKAGVITSLTLLTDLLPQPGRLAKAMLWPDPRGGAGAYLRDKSTGEPAAYFPEAFDLTLGTTPAKAETALVEVARAVPDPAARRAALAAVDGFSGTVSGALRHLARLDVPVPRARDLPEDLADPDVPVRASRALRRKVRIQADWLTVDVPVDREPDVSVVDNNDGTWTVSATVEVRPERTLV